MGNHDTKLQDETHGSTNEATDTVATRPIKFEFPKSDKDLLQGAQETAVKWRAGMLNGTNNDTHSFNISKGESASNHNVSAKDSKSPVTAANIKVETGSVQQAKRKHDGIDNGDEDDAEAKDDAPPSNVLRANNAAVGLDSPSQRVQGSQNKHAKLDSSIKTMQEAGKDKPKKKKKVKKDEVEPNSSAKLNRKYQLLRTENDKLRAENKKLKDEIEPNASTKLNKKYQQLLTEKDKLQADNKKLKNVAIDILDHQAKATDRLRQILKKC